MQPEKTQFAPGDVIADQYEVQRLLGRGGMGVVYLVHDTQTDMRVALKTLLPQYAANKDIIRRFVREVNAVRRLNHPAIAKIYDARREGHLLFYTMDYIRGKSLRKWMREKGTLGLGSTVRVLALLADALEHAHQYTVHRDISPENVMVLADGSVRLLDFGLAKLADNQGAFTQIGVSMGKFQYNAPEQTANATDVDMRADIFSLGVMFFEMLSGNVPEMGQKLTDLVPDLPEECNYFANKAMAMMPEQRFSSAKEFRKTLMRVYNISIGKARPGSINWNALGANGNNKTEAEAPASGRQRVAPETTSKRAAPKAVADSQPEPSAVSEQPVPAPLPMPAITKPVRGKISHLWAGVMDALWDWWRRIFRR